MASVLRPQFGQIFVRILKFRDPKFRDPNFREFPKIFSFSVREASVAKKVGGGGGGKGAGKAKKLLEVETVSLLFKTYFSNFFGASLGSLAILFQNRVE